MIKFVLGRAGSGKSTYILDEIKRRLADGDERLYLIVPEQQLVLWDAKTARELTPDSALRLEVISFTRLANLVARRVGGLAANYITSPAKALVMWNALKSVMPQLALYGKADAGRSVPSMLDAVGEMKHNGISPEMLIDAADKYEAEHGASPYPDKLRDAAMVYSAYSELLHDEYDDPDDVLDTLADKLREYDFFGGTSVFIDSFFTLTPKEAVIAELIFRSAANVTMTFACPLHDSGEMQFSHIRTFMLNMSRIAGEAVPVELTDNKRSSGDLAAVERGLWDYSVSEGTGGGDGSVTLTYASDYYGEAEAVACRIGELAAHGARYSEIAVIARDITTRRGIIDASLRRHGIPYFMSERQSISTHPAMRLIQSALSVASGGWQTDDVISLVKSGLTPMSGDEADAFTQYAAVWRIHGKRGYLTDGAWSMNPDGYTTRLSERAKRTLLLANTAKEKLVPPMRDFCDTFKNRSASATDICRAIYELLVRFSVFEQLSAKSAARAKYGDKSASALDGAVFGKIVTMLDTAAAILGDAECGVYEFAALLRTVSGYDSVGTIPTGADNVTLGSAASVRLDGVRHVLIIGAVAGEFPAPMADGGFFTDYDKERLAECGIMMSDMREDMSAKELFLFYRSAASPSDTLDIFIPDGGGSVQPSSAVKRILKLLPDIHKRKWSPDIAASEIYGVSAARQMYSYIADTDAGAALSLIAEDTSDLLPDIRPTERIPLTAANERISADIARLSYRGRLSLSQSKLDRFASCPFSYRCTYEMNLRASSPVRLNASDSGTFIHYVFERFFREISGQELPLDKDYADGLVAQIVDDYIAEVCPDGAITQRLRYMFARLLRSVRLYIGELLAEFEQSKFVPRAFELTLDDGAENSPEKVHIGLEDGTEVVIGGTIDRLDVYTAQDVTYVRIVDYKSGAKTFSLEDISRGENFQLLLYLMAVCRTEKPTFRKLIGAEDGMKIAPAGVMYFSASPGETKMSYLPGPDEAFNAVMKDIKRSGLFLSDEAVLRAMDSELSGKFIPVGCDKDGNIKADENTFSSGQLDELLDEVKTAVANIATEIIGGECAAAPIKHGNNSPCKYCEMRLVCRMGGAE